jgi:hypothetical protein
MPKFRARRGFKTNKAKNNTLTRQLYDFWKVQVSSDYSFKKLTCWSLSYFANPYLYFLGLNI